MTVTDRLITADEFMTLDDENGVYLELVRGRLTRIVVPGAQHGVVSLRLTVALYQHVASHHLGLAVGRTSFKLESNPDTVRVPDLSFVERKRVPHTLPESYFDGPPDLAGEVLCPTDPSSLIEEKLSQYLETGVQMVWIVNPGEKSVAVHRPGAPPVTLREGDVLDGADVVPGFSCDIRRLLTSGVVDT